MKTKELMCLICMLAVLTFYAPLTAQEDDLSLRLSEKCKTLYTEALELQKQGKWDSCIHKLKKVRLEYKDEYSLSYLMGKVYAQKKDYRSASEYFEEALALSKKKGLKDPAVFNALGYVYMKNYDYKKAEKYLLLAVKSIESFPEKSRVKPYLNLGNMYLVRDEYKDARKYFQVAADTYNSSQAKKNLRLIEPFVQITKTKYQDLARQSLERKDNDAAFKYVQQAIKVKEDKHSLYQEGMVLVKLKKYKDAVKSFKKALTYDAAYFPARLGLIKVYCLTGKKADAQKEMLRDPKLTETQKKKLQADKELATKCKELLKP
ncbi:MAG: tetratricopeptide repeat protein [bacterium]|nr:tetratricopeptide repeat protein [bacterium]